MEQIREAIFSHELPPGHRLSEAELGSRLGMSRTPVREALNVLVAEGLVRKDARGPFVASLTPSDVRQLLVVREVLDGLTASLAAQRPNDDLKDFLLALLEEMEARLRAGDTRKVAELDYRLHQAIAEASENIYAIELLRQHYGQMHSFRLFSYALSGVPEQSQRQHRKVVEAIVDGDPQRAEREAKAHVRFVMSNVVQELQGSTVRW